MVQNYRTVSARAIIIHQNKLLVEWFPALEIYFTPGGTVEAKEDLMTALNRELSEELNNAEVKVGKYLGRIGHQWNTGKGSSNSCLNHFFEAKIPESTSLFEITAKEPKRKIQWLDLSSEEVNKLQPPSLLSQIFAMQSGDIDEWDVIDKEPS